MQEIYKLDDISNLCETSEEENEVDDFKNSEQIVDKFKKTLFPKTEETKNLIHL